MYVREEILHQFQAEPIRKRIAGYNMERAIDYIPERKMHSSKNI
jgi:hypothetical protein